MHKAETDCGSVVMILCDTKEKTFSHFDSHEHWLIENNVGFQSPLITGHFSQLEWDVIHLGLREAKPKHRKPVMKAIKKPNSFRRFWHWMTGIEPPKTLADEKLETLRSFAYAHATKRDHGHLKKQLGHHGYNEQQIAAIAHLSRQHKKKDHK
ncbi:MAG: hypothetical protein ABF461_06175 [Zymomonas mobilis subsp. pomaceae]|uniref:hypothetical protein n=1 Tax=Zymomonas mobilis TaxID=542 RepID=UPI0039EC2F89